MPSHAIPLIPATLPSSGETASPLKLAYASGAAAAAKENYTIREAGADYVLGVIWSPQETTLT